MDVGVDSGRDPGTDVVQPGTTVEQAERARTGFRETFHREPDVVGRAPGRVNLIGEHTDYNSGLCLPLALPHATYAACGARDDGRVRVASAQQPDPWSGSREALGPGQVTGWAAYVTGVMWALAENGLELPGADVYVAGTVPLGAGLSSSAALECAVAVAGCRVAGLDLTDNLRRRLVAACMRAEAEVAGAPTGGMDQTVALLSTAGSALLVDFADHSTADVALPLADAGLALLVVDTRVSHALSDGGYAARRADCEAAARTLGISSLRDADLAAAESLPDERARRRARHVVTEIGRVTDTVAALDRADWAGVGALFGASHASLRDDFEVSCAELDATVVAAVDAGALGARMTGGGFGGSAIALMPADRAEAVMGSVARTFAGRGWGPPGFLRAEPSEPADLV